MVSMCVKTSTCESEKREQALPGGVGVDGTFDWRRPTPGGLATFEKKNATVPYSTAFVRPALSQIACLYRFNSIKMAKTPAKKAAKVAKAAATGEKAKKAHKKSRKESYAIYIYKVLKQVHPGELRPHPARFIEWRC